MSTVRTVFYGLEIEYRRVFEEGQPAIRLSRPYTLRRVCSADGDGGIDISEDKSNHLLIKPSTRAGSYAQWEGDTTDIGIHWAGVGNVVEGNVQLGVEVFSLPPFHLQIRQV